MLRISQIAVLGWVVLVLAGCGGTAEKPVWEDVKLGDLAPTYGGKGPGDQLLRTIDFDVYIFEIPVKKIGVLDEIRPMLYSQPLRFKNFEAFGANYFSVGFGQVQMWDKIGDLLREAGGKRVERVSLLLNNGQESDLTISRVDEEKTVFYIPEAGPMEGITIGAGKIALRLKAERITGSRGVCDVDAQPVFSPLAKSRIPQLRRRDDESGFVFASTGFDLKMSPGDFFFLGPTKYRGGQVTLDSYFFSRSRPRPVVRVYLVICMRMIY